MGISLNIKRGNNMATKYVRIYERNKDNSLAANVVSTPYKKKGKAVKTIKISY